MENDCCPEGRCQYRPKRVAWLQRWRGYFEVFAESPRTSLHQLEHTEENEGQPCEDPNCRAPGHSGTSEDAWTDWLLIAADLDRAKAAGCGSPEETARFLCPWAVEVENVRDEGTERRGTDAES